MVSTYVILSQISKLFWKSSWGIHEAVLLAENPYKMLMNNIGWHSRSIRIAKNRDYVDNHYVDFLSENMIYKQ